MLGESWPKPRIRVLISSKSWLRRILACYLPGCRLFVPSGSRSKSPVGRPLDCIGEMALPTTGLPYVASSYVGGSGRPGSSGCDCGLGSCFRDSHNVRISRLLAGMVSNNRHPESGADFRLRRAIGSPRHIFAFTSALPEGCFIVVGLGVR